MNQQDHYDRALAALNEAAFDDARWPEASKRMDEACGAKGNIVVIGRWDLNVGAPTPIRWSVFRRECRSPFRPAVEARGVVIPDDPFAFRGGE